MRVGDFSMVIIGGVAADDYVHMAHNTQYMIRLCSHSQRDCDVTLLIDGKRVDSFRLYAGEQFTLERPTNDSGRFTFYRAGSSEAAKAGDAGVDVESRGLITAIFKVGKATRPCVKMVPTSAPFESRCLSFNSPHGAGGQQVNCSAGVTGLSGHSDQRFVVVPDLDYDPAVPETMINLRLVCQADAHQADARELKPQLIANRVPPPVG